MKSFYLTFIVFCLLSSTKNKSILLPEINHSDKTNPIDLILNFDNTLEFQNCIRSKGQLLQLKNTNITINNNEFIY